jgi:hypothetical protein
MRRGVGEAGEAVQPRGLMNRLAASSLTDGALTPFLPDCLHPVTSCERKAVATGETSGAVPLTPSERDTKRKKVGPL